MSKIENLREEAFAYHEQAPAGKLAIQLTKPTATQRDLSLAYTPGVAEPVKAIGATPEDAYKYTAKGNLVAVVSNGSAILGLGNLGPLASKPVMEGKAVLFKKFADVDVFDIEIDCKDVDHMVETIAAIAPTFGGINLEDIKAPECFEVEAQLKERLDIPVFHDDQHGTAIVVAAALMNAIELTGKKIEDLKIVFLGAGAAGIATAKLLQTMGANHDNIRMIDRQGVIHTEREDLPKHKQKVAVETEERTLTDAMQNADVFIGVSGPNLVNEEQIKSMAKDPIIFALSNPDPEITPEEVKAIRDDAIIATGRSDYPNQVNNVLVFPYLFRGALDARAHCINDAMFKAAVHALAEIAKEPVPTDVLEAYKLDSMEFGREYLIPKPVDARLRERIPVAVEKAARESGGCL